MLCHVFIIVPEWASVFVGGYKHRAIYATVRASWKYFFLCFLINFVGFFTAAPWWNPMIRKWVYHESFSVVSGFVQLLWHNLMLHKQKTKVVIFDWDLQSILVMINCRRPLHWSPTWKNWGLKKIGQTCDLPPHSYSESERRHPPPHCRHWTSFQLFWTLIARRSHLHVLTHSSVSPQAQDCTNNHTVACGIRERGGGGEALPDEITWL